MFRALLITRMQALLSFLFRGVTGKKKRSKLLIILFGLLMLYAFASFFILFAIMFNSLIKPLYAADLGWLYFSIAGIISFALCFIGSIFTTQTQLFEARDNELLLSMPIPPGYILASRMTMLLVMNVFFELLVALPAGVIYCMNATVTAVDVIFFILLFTLLPFLVLTCSCLIGWVIALISSRMRNKSLITIVFSLAFLFGYFYFYSQANNYLNQIIQNGTAIAEAVKRAVFPAYHFGYAIAERNVVSLLWFLLITAVPFAAVYAILSKSFISIATAKKGAVRIKYTEKALKVSGIKKALVKKELKHFVSSPMYMLNGALGVIFTVILPFALLFKKEQIYGMLTMIPEFESMLGPAAILAICALASTNIISAPSISLEGKNLWIAQSFPIDGGDVLLSKVYAHMAVCIPAVLFASVLLSFILEITPLMVCLLLIVPVVMTTFQALLGVVINLRFPKFDWISETIAVKQSVSSLLTMFSSMGVVAAPVILYIFVLKDMIAPELFITLFAVILTAASAVMYRYLKTRGNAIFPFLG
ncbi:MAG: putative ABC transporter permease subunit [Eubacteriales bacterium]